MQDITIKINWDAPLNINALSGELFTQKFNISYPCQFLVSVLQVIQRGVIPTVAQQFVVGRTAITQSLDPAGTEWIFSCVQSGTKTSSVSDQP